MKIKYLLAIALVAMFAIPGTASQLAARNALSGPLLAPVTAATSGGAFADPNAAPQLTISLPTRFTALDMGTHPLQTFNG